MASGESISSNSCAWLWDVFFLRWMENMGSGEFLYLSSSVGVFSFGGLLVEE